MSDMKIQTGYNTKMKKPIFVDLTYDFFSENIGWEWFFKYKDKTIDIAWHKENGKPVYEFNINGYDEDAIRYEFNSSEELLENGRIDGKTLKEIWDDLEN